MAEHRRAESYGGTGKERVSNGTQPGVCRTEGGKRLLGDSLEADYRRNWRQLGLLCMISECLLGADILDRVYSTSESSNIDSGREKRRSARYHIDVRVRAKLISNGVLKILHGRGSDLSQHGMCVFLPTELGMHTTIAIEVTLPYCSQQVKLEAVVRNRRSFAYGIEFINITAAQQNLIEFTCRSLALLQ